MLMVFLMFAKWWKFITKKIIYIINIYFKFSNKFDIRIVYVFDVGIIIIISLKLHFKNNLFFHFFDNLFFEFSLLFFHFF
jgi:hypothetical protein